MQQRFLEKSNQMMEQNYKIMHADLQENAKRLHDFHHHLKVISGLAEQTQDDSITGYIEVSYRKLAMCRSGSDIIDAVINCSAAEDAKHGICFDYELYLFKQISVFAVELCAVLGNQIENAIEANLRVADISQRYVHVILTERGLLYFKGAKFCSGKSFAADGTLITRKQDNKIHGLGIKSIENTVEKYNGCLRNLYAENTFISEVLMCNRQFDT